MKKILALSGIALLSTAGLSLLFGQEGRPYSQIMKEIAAANEVLAPFRVLRGIECDILPDGRLDLPDDVLAELDWVQASVHGGQRMPAISKKS